jgi:type II secretory pathway component PulM
MNREQIVNWYTTLAPREQRVLQIGSALVVFMLVAGIILSLHRSVNAASAQLKKQQTDLEWMRSVGPMLAAAGPDPVAAATPESLVVLIDRSAGESGLAKSLTGTQPAPKGGMRVQLESADFNLLTGWLSRLSSQHGVRVESATITGSNTPGIVNATVQLRAR